MQHESIYYAYRRGQTDAWYGDRAQSTVWILTQKKRRNLNSF